MQRPESETMGDSRVSAGSPELIQERYVPERLLTSQGPMQTWLALDRQSQTQVVLKLIDIVNLQGWKQLEHFGREAQLLRQLQHPGLPRLLDAFNDARQMGLVIEFLPGVSLHERLAAGWRPGLAEVLGLADCLLEVIAYLHGFNPPYVHRDLKPSNVLLGEDGRVWLIDFGTVQLLLEPEGGATVVGSFGYMPPEQFCGQAVPASDLYGLGATLIHLLARRSPAEMEVSAGRLRFGPYLEAPAEVKDWLARLVAPLTERFKDAIAARKALQPLLQRYGSQSGASGSQSGFAAEFNARAVSAMASGPLGQAGPPQPLLAAAPPIRPLPPGLERLTPTFDDGRLLLSEPARFGPWGRNSLALALGLLHLAMGAVWIYLMLSGFQEPFPLMMIMLMPLLGLDALLMPLCQRRSLCLHNRHLSLDQEILGFKLSKELPLHEIQALSIQPSLTSEHLLKLNAGTQLTAMSWLKRSEAEALQTWLQEVTLEERHG